MFTIDIGLEHIDRIYHIADVHVRNVKRHEEYRQVFKKLYAHIKKTKTKNSIIYVAGDIVHAKTDMSPELVHVVSDFFQSLADIAPTIVICGNHDCNLNNANRLDAISPIVKALNHPQLHYLKDNGIYCISDVHFNVMSIFNKPSEYIKAKDFNGKYKIALHHGAVNLAQTDIGMTLSNTHVTNELFEGHDLVLLGDIHKLQFLDLKKTIAYPGSLIQQNYGEALHHGILVWDLATSTSEFVEIVNDYGYYTFEVDNGVILNPSTDVPKKPKIRLKVKDTESSILKTIVSELRKQYKVQEITIHKVNALSNYDPKQKVNFGNIRDVEWQNTAITDYLNDEYALDEELLDCVRHINRTVHGKLPESEITRNALWTPKLFEFSNMFSYGNDNVIDFSALNGSYGLFAPNASGKSTLLDALAFCCFDRCSRTTKAIHVLNNKRSTFECKFQFELDGKDYFIQRTGKKNNKGHVKVDVDFWYINETGEEILLNGDQRDTTNKIIRQYLGSYEDFVLTALSLQSNNTGFIDMSQRERKELLTQFLDIDVFEQQYQIANEEIRETAALIREYKRTDHSTSISEASQTIDTLSKSLKSITKQKSELESMKEDLTEIVINMTKELKTIGTGIEKPDNIIVKIDKKQIEIDLLTSRADEVIKQVDQINNDIINVNNELALHDQEALHVKKQAVLDNIDKHRDLTSKAKLLEMDIAHAEKMVSKLEKHQWDPNCKYCMANPWLQDTKKASERLPVLQLEYNDIQSELEKLWPQCDMYDISLEYVKIGELEAQYNKLNTNLSDLQLKDQKLKLTIQNVNSELQELNRLLTESIQHIDDLKFNEEKNEEIIEHQQEISDLTNEIKSLESNILQISGRILIAEQAKQDAEKAIIRLHDLEIQYKGYEYYLLSVKRDGVPYRLITKALPQIEAEINNILAQIVDFSILLETDGKNINGYIVYDQDNFWPLELTSGMEKFVASLAIRTSLIKISSLPRPNFLAIDEGFGVLDSDNLNSMFALFDYLKSQFGFIMCISHIDAMRDIVDKLIEIKKDSGYSKISYS
jgi:DNA repair exonuclease SbcCD ATPase subunit/predicted MPP superfamily phosphohydrolase